MSNNMSSSLTTTEGVIASFLALFFIYILACAGVGMASLIYLKDANISSNFLFNVFLANFITIFITLFFVKSAYKSKIIALLFFSIASGVMGTYKLSTINYYVNANYQSPEFYPEGSDQRAIVNAIIKNKDIAFLGDYDFSYLEKVNISKLGNMTNFFLIYGNRNEQIKTYELEFKALLNNPFISVWEYSKFEDKIIDYLTSSANSLQKNETVSMVYTIRLGV